jgi:hypothetical protein
MKMITLRRDDEEGKDSGTRYAPMDSKLCSDISICNLILRIPPEYTSTVHYMYNMYDTNEILIYVTVAIQLHRSTKHVM